MTEVGDRFDLTVDRVAHGGHCVGRHDGQVVFVRHALPGEVVTVQITGIGAKGRYLRADAIAVVEASADRVTPPCRWSGPGGCGGCDFQHASVAAQRALKAAVVAEQLQRFAGIDWAVVVEELPGSPDGLHWRTRVRLAVDGEGRPGFRRHRSHEVVATPDCPIVHPAVTATGVLGSDWTGAEEISIAAPADGGPAAIRVDRRRIGATRVTEHVSGRPFRVSGDGFWQVHPAAAQTLTDVVTGMVRPGPGERIADLYAGVGVFAAPLAEAVGTSGEVVMVEESVEACRDARRNLHDLPQAQIIQARVQRWLDDLGDGAGRFDAVVLDPPRAGAGAAVINGLDRLLGPAGRLCYVACDPAALGRDLADLGRRGWQLEDLRAFDAFPMTHHVECIAGLRRT